MRRQPQTHEAACLSSGWCCVTLMKRKLLIMFAAEASGSLLMPDVINGNITVLPHAHTQHKPLGSFCSLIWHLEWRESTVRRLGCCRCTQKAVFLYCRLSESLLCFLITAGCSEAGKEQEKGKFSLFSLSLCDSVSCKRFRQMCVRREHWCRCD